MEVKKKGTLTNPIIQIRVARVFDKVILSLELEEKIGEKIKVKRLEKDATITSI